jgi:hypothetical protein
LHDNGDALTCHDMEGFVRTGASLLGGS